MHNPQTDSGGILLGSAVASGAGVADPPETGSRVASLASLTLIPLRLDSVDRVDPDSPQVDVTGSAYLFDRTGWAQMPADVPDDKALELFDVCAAASQVRALAPGAATVCVLGAGHAGKLSLAAARDVAPDATLVCVDVEGLRPTRSRRSASATSPSRPTCANPLLRSRPFVTPAPGRPT